MSPITQIQDNSHILGVYSSPQRKIEEGLEYLRIGFEEKNEAIFMITNELTKNEVRNEIMKKWKISSNELADLERDGIINIKNSRKLYFSTKIIDCDKIIKQYSDAANKAIEKGKKGLRAFVDTRIFFERGYEKYVIEIEKSFSPSYDFPLTVICAYDLDDFEKLDEESRKILFDHHNLYLKNNLFRTIFDNSSSGLIEHICMYYEKESQSSSSSSSSVPIANSLLRYLGEGLQKDQLCVYLSLHNMEKDYPKIILSQIPNLKNPLIEKKFMVIKNSDDYYISATCDNLKIFEDLKRQIFEKAIIVDNKKEIRIVCDIPNFLFKNKHFDQCVALEEWWDQTIEELNKKHGLSVSLLCLYNNNDFQNSPFKYHKHRINDIHSTICDSEGIVHSKYSKFDLLTERKEVKKE
ncbi:MAG TPA: MEDS domain-containing protein [Nitrososphaeraceae archaeon]